VTTTGDVTRTQGARRVFEGAEQAQIDGIVDHLNANHADTVLLVARHVAPGVDDAEIVAIDPRGAAFEVRSAGVIARLRLEFDSPAAEVHDAQRRLLAAVGVARAATGPGVPLTSLEVELAAAAQLATVHATVRSVRPLTPNLVEVTLAGLDGYPLSGGDEFVFVMVSDEGDGIAGDYDMTAFREQPEGGPVRGAYYTIRRARPDRGELDLWVAVHDHPRTVASWMSAASEGAPLALWGPRRGFLPPADVRHLLMVADESGFAAVSAIVDATTADISITAVLETVDGAHHAPLPAHPGLRVEWVHRGCDRPGTVNRLLDAVRSVVTTAPDAAFGAAESRQISAVRKHVRTAFAISPSRVQMTGYWRADH
jgi:NADPH-dependent ferric siderophore reductase